MCLGEKFLKNFNGWDWAILLSVQPKSLFAKMCQWETLSGNDWVLLLVNQPLFADKCVWDTLEGSNWTSLLVVQPQFADKCPWEKLSREDWENLLEAQPQFADKCPFNEILDGKNKPDLWERFDAE